MNIPPVVGDIVTDHSEGLRWFVLSVDRDGIVEMVRVRNNWTTYVDYLDDYSDRKIKWASPSNTGRCHYSKIDVLVHHEDQQ
jgi:hypothetical protein